MKVSYYWKPLLFIKFKKSFFPLIVNNTVFIPIEYYQALFSTNSCFNFKDICEKNIDVELLINYIVNNIEEVSSRLNNLSEDKKWNKENVLFALDKMKKYIDNEGD